MLFTARQRDAILAIVNPSVCLPVCHIVVLYDQSDSNYDHAVFAGEQPHDESSFIVVNVTTKFKIERPKRGAT